MRLLHNCPCPVWVTRPELRPFPHNILVTSDFSPVSEITVKLGLAIGELSGAKVHVLHAVDYLLDRLYSVGLLYTNTEHYHANVKAEAHQQLTDQLARVAGGQPAATVELHIVDGGEHRRHGYPPVYRTSSNRLAADGDDGSRRSCRIVHRQHGRTLGDARALLNAGGQAG